MICTTAAYSVTFKNSRWRTLFPFETCRVQKDLEWILTKRYILLVSVYSWLRYTVFAISDCRLMYYIFNYVSNICLRTENKKSVITRSPSSCCYLSFRSKYFEHYFPNSNPYLTYEVNGKVSEPHMSADEYLVFCVPVLAHQETKVLNSVSAVSLRNQPSKPYRSRDAPTV
jgi:hypothetical protein